MTNFQCKMKNEKNTVQAYSGKCWMRNFERKSASPPRVYGSKISANMEKISR